jgi:hypothetical protein
MPEPETVQRAEADRRRGKSPSTQAGEFVREEIHHIREGVHGVRSTKQAIAIGLSKARRYGVKLPPPRKGQTSGRTRRRAIRDYEKGQHVSAAPSRRRSRATLGALRREGTRAASHEALSRHAHAVARRKTAAERSRAARKAAHTRELTAA